MKIPFSLALGMQNWLRVFTYDCYPADALTSGLGETADPKERWQLAVDTVYRFLTSGILWSPPENERSISKMRSKYLAYAEDLARHDPFSSNIEEGAPWHIWDLCCTDLCRDLVKKYRIHELKSGELSQPFVDELERIFEANGVPWRDEPLVEIGQR